MKFTINNKLTLEQIPNIINEINKITTTFNELDIKPNYYTIQIKSNNESLTIKKLTNNTLQSDFLQQVITNILTDSNLDMLKENNLSYKYIEYGDE